MNDPRRIWATVALTMTLLFSNLSLKGQEYSTTAPTSYVSNEPPRCCGDDGVHAVVRGMPLIIQGQENELFLHIRLTPGNMPQKGKRQTITNRFGCTVVDYQQDGIEYQLRSIVVSPVADDESSHLNAPSPCSVLMVQLTGTNQNSEYQDASARLTIGLSDSLLSLKLKGEMLLTEWGGRWLPLGAIRIAAEGIEPAGEPNRLSFRGHMPPGTSGSMCLKIPLSHLENQADTEWLMDLDFEDELRKHERRLRRARIGTGLDSPTGN